MAIKERTNITIDKELKKGLQKLGISISYAAEHGAKLLLSGTNLEKMDELIQREINSTYSYLILNNVKELVTEYRKLVNKKENPLKSKYMENLISKNALELDLEPNSLLYLIIQHNNYILSDNDILCINKDNITDYTKDFDSIIQPEKEKIESKLKSDFIDLFCHAMDNLVGRIHTMNSSGFTRERQEFYYKCLEKHSNILKVSKEVLEDIAYHILELIPNGHSKWFFEDHLNTIKNIGEELWEKKSSNEISLIKNNSDKCVHAQKCV